MSSICVCDPLHKLPEEIAREMREIAWFSGWVEANRLSLLFKNRVEPDQKTMDEAFERLLEYGLPSENACNIFKEMTIAASVFPANRRMGTDKLADEKERESKQKMDELVATGEIDSNLGKLLWEMCVAAGWHGANRRKFVVGFNSDAENDEARVKERLEQITGDFELYEIKFDFDNIVRTTLEKPRCCYVGEFKNNSELIQTKKFTYTHKKSITKSYSTTITWKFSLAGALGAAYVVGGGILGSMTYSRSKEEAVKFTDEDEKEYEYEFSVPPHSKATARALVEESEAKIPYFMIFRVGKEQKLYCKQGIWSGIVFGKSTYEVGECLPLD